MCHLTGACDVVFCSNDELAICPMKATGNTWFNSWLWDLLVLLEPQKLPWFGFGVPWEIQDSSVNVFVVLKKETDTDFVSKSRKTASRGL